MRRRSDVSSFRGPRSPSLVSIRGCLIRRGDDEAAERGSEGRRSGGDMSRVEYRASERYEKEYEMYMAPAAVLLYWAGRA